MGEGAIIGAVIGGIFGIMAYLQKKETNPIKRKKLQWASAFVVSISVSILFFVLNKFDIIGGPLKHMQSQIMENLIPELQEKFPTMEKHESMLLVNRGIKRLEDEDLLAWNRVRLYMANSNASVCAGFWNGIITQESIVDALSELSKEDQMLWGKVSAHAANLEFQNKQFYTVHQEDWNKGLEEIAKGLSPEDRVKLGMVLQKGLQASAEEGCFAMNKIMHFIEHSKSPMRLNVAHYLAQLTSQ